MTTKKRDATSEEFLGTAVEETITRAIFGGDEAARRRFFQILGTSGALALIDSVFPLKRAQALAQEKVKGIEKPDLQIGFIPITCGAPIIMAEPMGFYSKHGLNAKVKRAAGWAMIRDWTVNKDVDAAHMLSPMPLALTLGAGSQQVPFVMAAVENVNGQAITLAVKHKGIKSVKEMKGFRFCVPFDYSMHNYLLRYFIAEGGLHPDKDVQIRVVPPPEMVANLKAGNVDGYLGPDPFNQRAVYEEIGFIYKLSKEIWNGHPCCAFAATQAFAKEAPNTFLALFKAIVDATHFSSKPENRKKIAEAIAPKNYLNQPVIVVEQVLTGKFADGTGTIRNVPDRIDFKPIPWQSMAIWIMTQMKRWGHVKGDLSYAKIAEQVYLEAQGTGISKALGYKVPAAPKHTIMGKSFDPSKPEAYLESFQIRS